MTGLLNRVKVFTAGTGSGDVTAGAAASTKHMTPAEGGAVDGVSYVWLFEEGNNFEITRGIWTAGTSTIARTTCLWSKISGSVSQTKMNLLGNAVVSLVAAAEDYILAQPPQAKSAGFTVAAKDRDVLFICTGTFTAAFTAAATLGSTFKAKFLNAGAGVITLDPSGAELIDGAATATLAPGEFANVECTAAAFNTLSNRGLATTTSVAASIASAIATNNALRKIVTVRLATTGDITGGDLNNGDTLDGVVQVTNDALLVWKQTSPADNGIYVTAPSTTRHPDFATFNSMAGLIVVVTEGTANKDTVYLCTANAGGTLATTPLTFVKIWPPVAADISDSTALGRSILTAADAAAARAALAPTGVTFSSLLNADGAGATYTRKAGCTRIEVYYAGGGGGGSGAANSGSTTVAGSDGGDSTFNSVVAKGGKGAGGNTSATGAPVGGAGGQGGTGTATRRMRGGPGSHGAQPSADIANQPSGNGGDSYFGGGALAKFASAAGNAGDANTGAGGGGALAIGSPSINAGAGGGAGETVYLNINSPAASYTYTIGPGGAGGSSSFNGGAGGTGFGWVIEYYGIG